MLPAAFVISALRAKTFTDYCLIVSLYMYINSSCPKMLDEHLFKIL